MSGERSVFWSARHAIETMLDGNSPTGVPWLSMSIEAGVLVLRDDEGGSVALDLRRARPTGELVLSARSSAKLWLGVLNVARLLDLALARDNGDEVNPFSLQEAYRVLPEGIEAEKFEELGIAMGLFERRFRMWHLQSLGDAPDLVF